MIVEALVVVGGTLACVTWMGLRFAEDQIARDRREEALAEEAERFSQLEVFFVYSTSGRKYLTTCPFCFETSGSSVTRKIGHGPSLLEERRDIGRDNLLNKVRGLLWGPSSPAAVVVSDRTVLLQMCLSCGAEWLLERSEG